MLGWDREAHRCVFIHMILNIVQGPKPGEDADVSQYAPARLGRRSHAWQLMKLDDCAAVFIKHQRSMREATKLIDIHDPFGDEIHARDSPTEEEHDSYSCQKEISRNEMPYRRE